MLRCIIRGAPAWCLDTPESVLFDHAESDGRVFGRVLLCDDHCGHSPGETVQCEPAFILPDAGEGWRL